MAITDLTGTKWKFNSTLNSLPNAPIYRISGVAHSGQYSIDFDGIDTRTTSGGSVTFSSNVSGSTWSERAPYFLYPVANSKWVYSHGDSASIDVEPIVVEIIGPTPGTLSDYTKEGILISWFESNATQVIDPPTGLYKFLDDSGLSHVFTKLKTKFEQLLNGKANKVPSATQYNVALFDEHGDLYDGGVSMSDRATMRGWKDSETSWGTYIEQDQGGENMKSFGFMNSSDPNLLYWQMYADGSSLYKYIPTKEYVDGKAGISFEVGAEKWYGTYTDENGVTYQVYSKTVYIPALPSEPGITTYPHGVANIKQILSIYGFTTDGFVLNAPRQNAQDNIAIYQASRSASNQTFSIEVGKDRSSKKAYVTMIYAKNN